MYAKTVNGFRTVHDHGKFGCVAARISVIVVCLSFAAFFFFFCLADIQPIAKVFGDRELSVSALDTLSEVAIGVNIALTFIASITSYIVSQQEDYVSKYSLDNPTFIEAAESILNSPTLAERGVQVEKAKFLEAFRRHLQKEFAEFKKACEASTEYVKGMGAIVAIGFFLVLCVATIYPDEKLPRWIAGSLCFSAALPLVTHVIATWGFSVVFIKDVESFSNDDDKGAFQALARKIIRRFSELRTTLRLEKLS